MANNKRKEKKKLARAKVAKARVLARRKKIKEAHSAEKKQARYAHKFREKLKPIVNDPEKAKQMEENREKVLKEKLEQNAEMLKHLESQYEAEMANKEDINKKLEEEGHITFQEKLAALEKQVIDKMEADSQQSGGPSMAEVLGDVIDAEAVGKTENLTSKEEEK